MLLSVIKLLKCYFKKVKANEDIYYHLDVFTKIVVFTRNRVCISKL